MAKISAIGPGASSTPESLCGRERPFAKYLFSNLLHSPSQHSTIDHPNKEAMCYLYVPNLSIFNFQQPYSGKNLDFSTLSIGQRVEGGNGLL